MVANHEDLDRVESELRDKLLALEDDVRQLRNGLRKMDNRYLTATEWIQKLEQRLDSIDPELPKVRRRMNRSISTKGIIQYDGTVETHGFSRQEFEAEQTWMDELQNRLQPIYEEFVEPVVIAPIEQARRNAVVLTGEGS